jgi:hypothetical protein
MQHRQSPRIITIIGHIRIKNHPHRSPQPKPNQRKEKKRENEFHSHQNRNKETPAMRLLLAGIEFGI